MSSIITPRRGRPLTFLLMIALCWAGLRFAVVSLWPEVEEPSAFVPQVAALEEPRGALLAQAIDPAAGKENPLATSEEAVPSFENQPPSVELVEGLEPAPPAHFEAPPVPLPAAAAHNALWMAASRLDVEAGSAVEDEGDKKPAQQEF